MKTTVMNPVKAFTHIALGLAIAPVGIHVADADDAPGAAVIGMLLMVVGVVLGVRAARSRLPVWAARTALAVGAVVSHVKLYSPADSGGFVQGYFPFLELPENGITFVVKTALDPNLVIAEARRQVQAVDPDQPIYDVATVSQRLSDATARQRFNLLLLGLFAALALALAVVGIYGVMSYSVTQRTHEIGLRIALGAQSREVLKLVVGHALKLALLGGALGLISAALLTRLMANLLFGITPTDPITFALVVVTLAGVSFAAAWLPARRATRVDPMVALRFE
jgi:hypothetical protein